jgi:hypothetical protein
VQSGQQTIRRGAAMSPVQYEVRYYGCSACATEPGAPAAAACSSPKICAAPCFACRSGQSSVSVRACVEGRCADQAQLNQLVGELALLAPCVR